MTYAIGMTLGRTFSAYETNSFGNPKTITETKRYIKSKIARAVSRRLKLLLISGDERTTIDKAFPKSDERDKRNFIFSYK